ncbi:ABC transporter ATP-binding protein [Enterococcus hirae]|nr:ABC transporter ATP-binding protein [Enterococcus hirae]
MNAIEIKHLTKKFGNFTAIDDISMSVKKGEIHAICGENGAGKSTLMNMLFGLIAPTSGEIYIDDELVQFNSPKAAIKYGIGMVHQHFKLVPSLKVYENVLLGEELSRHGYINTKLERKQVQETIDKFGFDLNANDVVASLSVGAQQRVEIIKMLHRNVNILILDEPTAVLTPKETDELLEKLVDLKNQGKTIILITHKLDEVKKCSDRVTVIQKGKFIITVDTKDVTQKQISRYMVGRDVQTIKTAGETSDSGNKALELRKISFYTQNGKKVLDDIDLHVNFGEVVGIAGIEGNGQSELVNILTGVMRQSSGEFVFKGEVVKHSSPLKLRELGFGLVPEDRYKDGLNAEMSIWENVIAGHYNDENISRGGFLNRRKIDAKTKKLVEDYDIRNCSDVNAKVSSLSGGNAQKIIMAREISVDPEVIVMSQPTRGVDIGSIEFIHSKILDLRNEGKAVLIISSELSEIMNLSDRIYVMYKGKISGERQKCNTNKEDLGMLMVGIDQEEKGRVTSG